jgi:hypothetical protein
MYVLKTPETGWLASVLDVGSTREGREKLIQTMKEAATDDATDRAAGYQDDKSAYARQRAKKRGAR